MSHQKDVDVSILRDCFQVGHRMSSRVWAIDSFSAKLRAWASGVVSPICVWTVVPPLIYSTRGWQEWWQFSFIMCVPHCWLITSFLCSSLQADAWISSEGFYDNMNINVLSYLPTLYVLTRLFSSRSLDWKCNRHYLPAWEYSSYPVWSLT